ncbi:MAG: TetR/AcrR family transcriptional regulator, partial [Alphaproteobacteria bacterium]
LHDTYPSRTAIVTAMMEKIDAEVLGGIDPSAFSEPPRDRLLDALMRRFDALAPYKKAIDSILRDLSCDPLAVLCAAPGFLHSMAWTLEAAGIGSSGLGGRIRTKGLAAIYLSALRVWLADDSPDLERTMAHLDRKLRRAERLVGYLPDGRRDEESDADAA